MNAISPDTFRQMAVILASSNSQAQPEIACDLFDLQAFDDIALGNETEYLLEGIIPTKGLGIIYGPPGCGKSFLAQHIAVSIARGVSIGGRSTNAGPVVYVALEGHSGINKRVVAHREHYAYLGKTPLSLLKTSLTLDGRGTDAEKLIKTVEMQCINPISMIIIDTLARAATGLDENSTADMSRFIEDCELISSKLNCFVLVVHHSGKDANRGMRGSSSLRGAADIVLEVRKDKIHSGTVRVDKAKDAEDNLQIKFRLVPVALENDETSCVAAFDGDWSTTRVSTSGQSMRPRGKTGTLLKIIEDAEPSLAVAAPAHLRLPTGTKVLEYNAVRDAAKRVNFADSGKDAKHFRSEWSRSLTRLAKDDFIGKNGAYIWLNNSVQDPD